MDSLLVSGGNDIAPMLYGAEKNDYTGTIVDEPDKQDFEIVRYFLNNTSKLLLGICRGIQMINVACGGSLYQDLKQEAGCRNHFILHDPYNEPIHTVSLQKESRIAEIFESDTIPVNLFHHQGIKDICNNFVVGAFSEEGVIEEIEMPGMRFAIAVQWHPEMMFDSDMQLKLFKAFINACEVN